MYTHASIRAHIHTQKRVILFSHNNGIANAPQFYVIRILPVLLKYDWIITCHDSNSFDFLYVQILRKFFTPQPNKRDLPIFNADGTREFVKLPDKILHLPEALLVFPFLVLHHDLCLTLCTRIVVFCFIWRSTRVKSQVSSYKTTCQSIYIYISLH